MINIFRKLRYNLIGKQAVPVGRYMKYAVGEIVLVVIGILIALSINSWNNSNKDRDLEKQYIAGLIIDLQADSLAIAQIKLKSDEQVRRKEKLTAYFEGQAFSNDSLAHFFVEQWGMAVGFNPSTTTLDEMKSTGRIGVIQNADLRKQIIKTYNNYLVFINGTQAYYQNHRLALRNLVFKIPRVYDMQILKNSTSPDIAEALKNDELKNRLLTNYAISVNGELRELQTENNALLMRLNGYLKSL